MNQAEARAYLKDHCEHEKFEQIKGLLNNGRVAVVTPPNGQRPYVVATHPGKLLMDIRVTGYNMVDGQVTSTMWLDRLLDDTFCSGNPGELINSALTQAVQEAADMNSQQLLSAYNMHRGWAEYANNRPWQAAGYEHYVRILSAEIISRMER